MFAHTRFLPLMSEFTRNLRREIKVALTPIPKRKKWVFLVGCYNSGTTLLAEMLGRHPKISALPTEGHFITDQFIKDYEIGLPRMWVDREDLFIMDENSTGPDPGRIKKEWAMRLEKRKPVFLEKSPPNVSKMRWLDKHFENACFIGIIRNGYAVSEGITRKASPQHLVSGWPIEKSAYQWKRSNEIMMQNSKRVEKFILITYEDLVENTIDTLVKVTDFIGVDPFRDDLANEDWVIHERSESVRNMNFESISKLTETQRKTIKSVAGEMLDRFNYSCE